MSNQPDKIYFVLGEDTESKLPPCGCAIGDLLALQADLPLPDGTIKDQFKEQVEADLPPPCGARSETY